MSKMKLLLVAVLCVGMFFVSGVFAERITIDSSTTSATIDGEYGEEDTEAYGVYVDYAPFLSLTFTEDAVGNIVAENEDAYACGVYTTRDINIINHQGSMTVEATGDSAYAEGILTENTNLTSLNNSGDITVSSTGYDSAYAYGVYSYSEGTASSEGNINYLNNSGTITATAIQEGVGDGEIGSLSYYYDYDVVAFGVLAESYAYSGSDNVESSGGNIISLNNSGTISAAVYVSGLGAFSYAFSENGTASSSGGNVYSLTNSGDITATGTGQYYVEVYGVSAFSYTDASDGEAYSSGGNIYNLTNTGTISATAIVDMDSEAYAYGIYTYSYAYSYDYYAESSGGNITNLTNSGTISATAEGYDSHAVGIYAEAEAYGDDYDTTGGVITGLNNSGTISATAGGYDEEEDVYLAYNAYSWGIAAEGGIYSSTNSGDIVATSEGVNGAYAGGIGSEIISDFTNSGTIEATAEGYGWAASAGVMDFFMSNFDNSGTISASSTGYEALAAGVSSMFIDGLTNSGTIKAEAVCDSTNVFQDAFAEAVGIGGLLMVAQSGSAAFTEIVNTNTCINTCMNIHLSGSAAFTEIVNTGTINASVKIIEEGFAQAAGIIGNGGMPLQEGESTIINEGLILVQAEAPEGTAPENIRLAGIVITGGDVIISNPGEIRLESNIDGVEARALVITEASVTIDNSFAVTLGSPGIGHNMAPIYVENGTLDLNGATLIVRADTRNLQLDTPYPIIENDEGTVDGEWAEELERGYANKSIVVSWVDENELGENSAVIFTYDPREAAPEDVLSPGMGGMTGTPILVSSITQQLNPFSPLNVDTLLVKDTKKSVLLASNGVSDAGLPGLGATERYRGFWFMPVYTRLVGEDIGYDANAYGLALGIGGKVSEAGYLGGYAGYTKGTLDFDIASGDKEEQNIFFGGINAMYGPTPWYVRFGCIGYYADHSYEGYTGMMYELDEEASYDSVGFDVELAIGGNIGDAVRFVPEVGLAYQYVSTESFKTKVPDDNTWERKIKPEDISVLKGLIGMSIVGGVGSPTQVYFGARLEYALSDNDVSAVNSLIGGTEFDIEREMDDRLLSLTAGLNHNFGNSWSLEVGLRGDLSEDYNAYTGRMFIRKSF